MNLSHVLLLNQDTCSKVQMYNSENACVGSLILGKREYEKQADPVFVITEWLFIAIRSDGKHIDITSKSADSNSLTELGNLLSIIVEEETNTGPSVPIS